jgi:hypothetical protein
MFFLMMSFLLILLKPTSNHFVSAKKNYHLSKIKFPTFDEALDNLEDIIHSGSENVHLLSLRAPVYGKSPAAVLQPKEERIFQQPCSSSPRLESVLPPCCEVCVFFLPARLFVLRPSNPFTGIHSLRNRCEKHDTKTKNLPISDSKNKNKDLNLREIKIHALQH